MADENRKLTVHERWAHLRFSVIGPLLAAPPVRGELQGELRKLAEKQWLHPVTAAPTQFGVSTIERWYHQAKRERFDPVGVLRRKIRKDSGQAPAIGDGLKQAIHELYKAHRGWSYALHYDNLAVLAAADPTLGPLPSYSTVRRFMKAHGLWKRRRLSSADTAGVRRAEARLDEREVRSFEAEYVHGLWHLDFHSGSKKVLTPDGEWVIPQALAILDDRSRLVCHAQWYDNENAENLVHGLSQAIQKRQLPRSLMTDNGTAMKAGEVTQGLARLGILHHLTLPYSAYQNAKQEVFWAQLEGRLIAMLEGVRDLTLPLLNQATQAWVEMEYHRTVHSEIHQSPVERYLQGPDVGRSSPDSQALRLAFTIEVRRTQRRSDGTLTLEGCRFEIPAHYRTLERVAVRYATWDLTQVHLVDERTGAVLCRLYPLDKALNADGLRRRLPEDPLAARDQDPPTESGMAPLMRQLMKDYAATGLPPAYLPQHDASAPQTTFREDQP